MPRARKKTAQQADVTTPETTNQPVTHENEAEPVEPDPVEPSISDQQTEFRQQAAAIVQEVADGTKMPDAEPPATGFAAKHASGHVANPSSKRRESFAASARKLPGKLMVKAGDLAVRLIDAGDNRMGIGIRVEVPEDRTLTEDEKAIIRRHVKGEDGENTGYTWDASAQLWHKPIVRDNEFEDQVPPSRPVAIRLDGESRVEKLAAALREHQADPVSYAEMVRQQREHAAEAGRIRD